MMMDVALRGCAEWRVGGGSWQLHPKPFHAMCARPHPPARPPRCQALVSKCIHSLDSSEQAPSFRHHPLNGMRLLPQRFSPHSLILYCIVMMTYPPDYDLLLPMLMMGSAVACAPRTTIYLPIMSPKRAWRLGGFLGHNMSALFCGWVIVSGSVLGGSGRLQPPCQDMGTGGIRDTSHA